MRKRPDTELDFGEVKAAVEKYLSVRCGEYNYHAAVPLLLTTLTNYFYDLHVRLMDTIVDAAMANAERANRAALHVRDFAVEYTMLVQQSLLAIAEHDIRVWHASKGDEESMNCHFKNHVKFNAPPDFREHTQETGYVISIADKESWKRTEEAMRSARTIFQNKSQDMAKLREKQKAADRLKRLQNKLDAAKPSTPAALVDGKCSNCGIPLQMPHATQSDPGAAQGEDRNVHPPEDESRPQPGRPVPTSVPRGQGRNKRGVSVSQRKTKKFVRSSAGQDIAKVSSCPSGSDPLSGASAPAGPFTFTSSMQAIVDPTPAASASTGPFSLVLEPSEVSSPNIPRCPVLCGLDAQPSSSALPSADLRIGTGPDQDAQGQAAGSLLPAHHEPDSTATPQCRLPNQSRPQDFENERARPSPTIVIPARARSQSCSSATSSTLVTPVDANITPGGRHATPPVFYKGGKKVPPPHAAPTPESVNAPPKKSTDKATPSTSAANASAGSMPPPPVPGSRVGVHAGMSSTPPITTSDAMSAAAAAAAKQPRGIEEAASPLDPPASTARRERGGARTRAQEPSQGSPSDPAPTPRPQTRSRSRTATDPTSSLLSEPLRQAGNVTKAHKTPTALAAPPPAPDTGAAAQTRKSGRALKKRKLNDVEDAED
ncbi:hypothetical protein PUNSTDRAFT_122298 [Punctularia strigosozonata HHB-11173 SS5]|uniref:uncharacterized protein n=1 Tax=Punctularia strigosozonata (strain HHB-11173) TaxID=741275 RepID=UPI00044176AE|nr:uncharacterized protein PUNSTDRAFT_122298 [Punctularia strigosozonata HHB-11173 SS5]EIN05319.1 hypothetical protein PUNSTDRAFT_122298 [Punctularia strigosozonata HHB-11173 SS5]